MHHFDTGLHRSSVIIISGEPVIGTLLKEPASANPGEPCVAAVEPFFSSYGLTDGSRLQKWQQQMWERDWAWQLRYPSPDRDLNATGRYKERRTDGRTEVFYPSGFRLPPDGWLITPHFLGYSVCDGQIAYQVKGVEWLPEEAAGLRKARLEFTGVREFVPLHVYAREDAAA